MAREIIHQHIPKTGSSSTKRFWPGCVRDGFTAGIPMLNENIPEGDKYISFAIIRNPLERFLSCVKMFSRRKGVKHSRNEIVDICLNHNFSDEEMFLRGSCDTSDEYIAFHSISIFHPFINVFDENKKPKVDHFIDFTNMIAEFKAIMPEYDYSSYPKLNVGPPSNMVLTDDQTRRFEERYSEDIEFYKKFVLSRIKRVDGIIDVCIAIYRNYDLLQMQLDNWSSIDGEFRFLVCDNTPKKNRRVIKPRPNMIVHVREYGGIDGTRHGSALDLLIRESKSNMVAICDSDFFWVDEDIVNKAKQKFAEGCRCYGAELWYDDFDIVYAKYPDRSGLFVPSVFGMFIDRELALSESFIVSKKEGRRHLHTGWRMSKKIDCEGIDNHLIRANKQYSNKHVLYGSVEEPSALHFVKGSSTRITETKLIPEILEEMRKPRCI